MRNVTIPKGFVLAMRASVSFALYGTPHLLRACGPAWILVSRWGNSGELMTLSWTGAGVEPGDAAAPPDLAPRLTCLGLLMVGPDARPGCDFLLTRRQPGRIPVAGTFLPCEGYACLEARESGLHLTATGRHGGRGRRTSRLPAASPCAATGCMPDAATPHAWRLSAQAGRWIGEVGPGSGSPG